MAALIQRLAPQQGYTRSLLEGVRLMRADGPLGRTPVLYEPSIMIVCQGHKRGYQLRVRRGLHAYRTKLGESPARHGGCSCSDGRAGAAA